MAFNDPVISLPTANGNSKNFMNENSCDFSKDRILFFDDEHVDVFSSTETMADIVFRCGLFPSKSQARKNGWDIPIPNGFNCFVVGKKKFQIWILNCM